MTIKTQKFIRFIPVVNLITVIFWFKMIIDQKLSATYVFKPMIKVLIAVIIITIPRVIVYNLFDWLWVHILVSLVSAYLYDVALAWVFVREQEKYCE